MDSLWHGTAQQFDHPTVRGNGASSTVLRPCRFEHALASVRDDLRNGREPRADEMFCAAEIDVREGFDVFSQLVQDGLLYAPALIGEAIRNLVVEHHHRIARYELLGETSFELQG